MAQHPHGKPAPMEMSHIATQISTMSVAPAAEPQKREIVGKLNELASQMKHWAVQVEEFASLLNSSSIIPGRGPPQKPHSYPHPGSSSDGAHYASRGAPNGYPPYPGPSQQPPQQYSGSQHYQFHVQQYQGRHPDGASPHGYPLGTAGQSQPETSPSQLTTSIADGNERPGKRRRKTDGQRRKKDPLAPKRPPSAYILYQNDVRKQMQDKHPELSYSDVLGKISESWQTLDENKKKVSLFRHLSLAGHDGCLLQVYLDMVERDKVRYEDEKLRYNMGQDIPTKPTPRRPLSALRAPSEAGIDAEVEGEEGEEEAEGADQDDQEPEVKRARLEGTPADAPAGYGQSYPRLQATTSQQEAHTPDPSGHEHPHSQTSAQPAPQVAPSPAQQLQPHAHNLQPSRHPTPQNMPPPRPPSQASQASHSSASLSAHQSPQLSHVSPRVSPQQTHLQVQHPGHPMPHLTPGVEMGVSSGDGIGESGGGQPVQAPSQP
ncbi:hypothetical protein FRC06_001633 [Ceratobasidium sp. 370]|nr:hypothetical protein FRC06_001633 [Ceratobasidium sp. 370]